MEDPEQENIKIDSLRDGRRVLYKLSAVVRMVDRQTPARSV